MIFVREVSGPCLDESFISSWNHQVSDGNQTLRHFNKDLNSEPYFQVFNYASIFVNPLNGIQFCREKNRKNSILKIDSASFPVQSRVAGCVIM